MLMWIIRKIRNSRAVLKADLRIFGQNSDAFKKPQGQDFLQWRFPEKNPLDEGS